jgi:inositol transport system permease protein
MNTNPIQSIAPKKENFLTNLKDMGFAGIYSKYGTALIFIGILILATVTSPIFLTQSNLTNVLRQVVVVSLLGCGVTFIIILGHIDVSLGSVIALTGTMAASVMQMTQNIFLACLAGIAVGIVVGMINGFVITYFNIPAFIMTLATTTVARGAILIYTKGTPVSNLGNFKVIGQGDLGPIPISVIILIIVIAISWIMLNRTKFGRYVYAVGGNVKAAVASGINAKSIVRKAFVYNGILSGIAGIVLMSRINSGQPAAGVGYEFDAITGVVVGGTSLMGGSGTIIGTIIGSLIVGVINNMLNLLNVTSYWQQVVKGLIILIAVILDVQTKTARVSRKKA